jgi:alginate O-acetyltransferase complex protein AlgI
LGGNRVKFWRWQFNLIATFIVSGLWHGANWTFIVWSALNGFYLLFSIWTKTFRDRAAAYIGLSKLPILNKCCKVIITFSLICFSWIFFRATNLKEAWYIATHLFKGLNLKSAVEVLSNMKGLEAIEFQIMGISLLILGAVELIQRYGSIRSMIAKQPIYVRWGLYYSVVMTILLFGEYGSREFIYFTF